MSDFDLERLTNDSFVRQVEYLPETASTNDVALQMVAEGRVKAPSLVLTSRQTAGRGRGGNCWWSSDGALTFSLILQPEAMDIAVERWPRISLVAALAVCSAIEMYLKGASPSVKWPNDVFCRGRKVSGILVEVPAASPIGSRHLVLGIGINVNNSWAAAPADLQSIGAALCDISGQTHDPTEILVGVVSELQTLLKQLADDDPRLPALWRERSLLTGRWVCLELGGDLVEGRCLGIDACGALELETNAGVRRLIGGIVHSFR